MDKFYVLHLSDLHISETDDPGRERLRKSLLTDIRTLAHNNGLRVDCVGITGDITDRGGSTGSYAKARNFLDELSSELSLGQDRIAIIPGNHDIPRREILTNFLEKCQDDDFSDRARCSEHWDLLSTRFKAFFDFVKSYDLRNRDSATMFGGAIKDIATSSGTIRLFLLNTAWASCGKSDYGKQRIGRWQLEELSDASGTLPPADLTLALAHHPLEWLTSSERELLLEFLSKYLKVEVLLHGHIHTGKIDVHMDPDNTLVRLVSGIGYPNAEFRIAGQPKMSGCRYALYSFNFSEGTLEGWLRTSAKDGSFAADTLLYRAAREDGHFGILYKPNVTPLTYGRTPTVVTSIEPIIELDPVPMISDWVGREEELLLLRDRRTRVAAITGVGGQGKTGIASEFFRRYARGKAPPFEIGVWADCRELPDSLHSKIVDVLCALSGGKETQDLYRDERVEDTARRLLRHFQRKTTLLVLDNIDAYIKADAEGATKELKPFLDAVLNNEHFSMLLLTCRPPLADSRGAFVHLLLSGLKEEDGIALFKKRKISIITADDLTNCLEIVRRTKGHPWWLGIIAGQISSKRGSLQACADRFRSGDFSASTAILDYFGGVWRQLKSSQRKLLRYLIESARPLSESEISKVTIDFNPKRNLSIELWRMQGFGLLERHQGTTGKGFVFQVHPLIREYVHQSFPTHAQRHYVHRVLCVFLPSRVVALLFQPDTTAFKKVKASINPNDLSDSIETCLNSRNDRQALALLEKHKSTLYDQGFHHRYLSIACRILDRLDWERLELVQFESSASVIATTIDQLELGGNKERSAAYLERYKKAVEPKSVPYLGFLSVAAHFSWQRGEYQKAVQLCDEYEMLSTKLNSRKFEFNTVPYTRGLALRDDGNYEEALTYFESKGDSAGRASDLGNSARCQFYLGHYHKAEQLLQKSLRILKDGDTHLDRVNLGYAYLWIAELMMATDRNVCIPAFVTLARKAWSEYAPGLLSRINEFCLKLNLNVETVSDDEMLKAERNFLSLR